MEGRVKTIYSWFVGKIPNPYKIVMSPTNRCNLKCPFCPNSLDRIQGKFKKKDELSDKEWKKIIKEGLEIGVKEWSIIGGGEPFLRRSVVMNAVRMIKKVSNTDCEIITNGTLIRESDVKKLVKYELDRILVSIDGPNAKIHDSLRRVKGTFEKATRTIKRFAYWKPYIKVNMVLNKKNYKEIIPMLKLLKTLGVQELALHPMREYYNIPELKQFNLRKKDIIKIQNYIKECRTIAQRYGILLNTDMVELEVHGTKKRKTKIDTHQKFINRWCYQ